MHTGQADSRVSNTFTRRRLLGSAGLAAASLLGLGGPPWRGCNIRAIEPIRRSGTPKFKFSMAAYGYRNLLTGDPPPWTLHDFVNECASLGLEGTELTSYYFPSKPTDGYLAELKAHCFRLGLDVSGTAVGNDFCHPAGEERSRQIELVKRWIEYAARLGAPVIRIFSGAPHGQSTVAQARRLAIEAMEECCEYAGKYGLFLALENHGGLTATPEGLLELVRGVRSPWLGVNLDTGNFHGDDVYADLAQLAPYAMNVQVKVVVQPANQPRQPTDMARLAQILRDVGYRGYIVLEYEEEEDPRTACPRHIDQLRRAFAS